MNRSSLVYDNGDFKTRSKNSRNSKYYCYRKFGPMYYVGFLFGVLPITCYTERLYFNDNADNSLDDAFKISKFGLSISYVYLSINLFIFGQLFVMTIEATKHVQSCMEEFCESTQCRNVCGHFILIWTNFLANFVSVYSIVFHRRKQTVDLLNEINSLLSRRLRAYRIPWTSCGILFFMPIQCTSYYLQWKMSHFHLSFVTRFTALYLTQCLPIVTENAITVMLLALELSYDDVNRKLSAVARPDFYLNRNNNNNNNNSLEDRLKYLKDLMRYLMYYHWKVTDIAEHLSDNFQLDFLSVGFCSTVRFIYFLFLALKYLAEQPSDMQRVVPLPGIDFLIFFLSVLGKFIYLCYRCDKVTRENRKSLVLLHQLRIKFSCERNRQGEIIVNEFIDQVSSRDVSFRAFDLFTLNLHLIFSVFGFTLTYFIVLLQLQVYHQK